MAIQSVTGVPSAQQNAYGLDFQSLLSIILTQLTYQDPLKPVDNFQFVSQLAQFSQLQQSQTLNDQISGLLASQAASQATSLLGRSVEAELNGATYTGTVREVSFSSGQPTVRLQTESGLLNFSIPIANIVAIRS